MVGGVPADLSAGKLDLGRQDNTLSYNISRTMTVDGDLKLGEFVIYGTEMGSPLIDRVNVTGELDLTNASIHPESVVQVWSSNVPTIDHFVIATYGNRIGSFPQSTVTYSDWLPIQFEMPIHYTDLPPSSVPLSMRVPSLAGPQGGA